MTPIHHTRFMENVMRNGSRPPLEIIPTNVAELLVERDRIAVQMRAAEIKVRDLAGDHLDAAAQQADDDAATTAARSGKPIPKTSKAQKLAEDREQAARERAAQEAALLAVTNEASTAMSEAYPWDTIAATRAQTRVALEAAAHALADQVEAAFHADAAVEWLRGGAYSHNEPRAHVEDLVNLSGINLVDQNKTESLRGAIVNAATAPFTSKEI